MEFRVLGPLEIHDGGHVIPIGTPRVLAVLALLLVRPGTVVSVDRFVDELWPEDPPADTRALVHGYLSHLRRALRRAPDANAAGRLITRKPGYLLLVDDNELDLHRFQRLISEARAARREGALDRCVALFRQAQKEWRSTPFADAPATPTIAAEAVRLTEMRVAAIEDQFDAALEAGQHAAMIAELVEHAAAHPFSERATSQLMLALHRVGRSGDALAAFRRLRQRLADDLGLEPGPEVQRLHRAILGGDSAQDPSELLAAATAVEATRSGSGRRHVVPRQLPRDVAEFTGRDRELAAIRKALGGADGSIRPMPVWAISGAGGIGKSALALHAAHELVDRFPDGQLYVDLQGTTAGVAPLPPLDALGRFLRAFDLPAGDVPGDVEEAAARFRTEVAGRRLLVVLDNAVGAAQVRQLLPGTPQCAVIVTSRRALLGLTGACHVHLDLLSEPVAVDLLARLVGEARVAAEPQAAAEVARCCGYLPLALRIAGARLAARPCWPIARLAALLAAAQHRLDELQLDDEVGVRASFDLSYRQMGESTDFAERDAARAFTLLGLWDGPDIDLPVAARLLDRPEVTAEPALERLVDAGLLETPSSGRYRLHDLIRLFARDTAARRFTAPERAAAVSRILHFYTATAWRTTALLLPGNRRLRRIDDAWAVGGRQFADAAEALAWLEAERANLVAAVTQGANSDDLAAGAVQLTDALFGFFLVRGYWLDWEQGNQTVLAAAELGNDLAAQAQALNDLGVICTLRGTYEDALGYLRRSAAVSANLDDRSAHAATLTNLGNVSARLDRYPQAIDFHRQSLAIRRQLQDRAGEASALDNLGDTYLRLGSYTDAIDCIEQSLEINRHLGDRSAEAVSLNNLGEACGRQGRHAEAIAYLGQSLAIHDDLGDRRGQANNLMSLGWIHHAQKRYTQALDCYERSRTLCHDLGHRHEEAEVIHKAGAILTALGRIDEAKAHQEAAAAIFEQLGLDPPVD